MSHKLGWAAATIAGGVLLLAGAAARADVFSFHLEGVTFDDGGTATGSFTLDTLKNNLHDVNIVTSTTSTFTGNSGRLGRIWQRTIWRGANGRKCRCISDRH